MGKRSGAYTRSDGQRTARSSAIEVCATLAGFGFGYGFAAFAAAAGRCSFPMAALHTAVRVIGGGWGRGSERRAATSCLAVVPRTQHHHSYMQCSVQKASDDSDGGDDTTPGFFALVGETRRRGKWCHRVDSQRRAQPWIGAVEGMSTVRNLC